MGLIGLLASDAWSALAVAVPFVVVLGAVVFVHEFGHFAVGRRFGVKVETFSVGMGPEVAGVTDRKGTRWRVSAVPLGGYVRFAGDRNIAGAPDGAPPPMSEAERRLTLEGQPLPRRAAIVAAGPAASLFAAFLVFSGLAYFRGEITVPPRVGAVLAGSAAEAAGFRAGDLVRSIDGRAVVSFSDIFDVVAIRSGEALAVVVERDGRDLVLTATPALTKIDTPLGKQRLGRLGLVASQTQKDARIVYPSLGGAAEAGLARCRTLTLTTVDYVWRVIVGRAAPDQLSGPVRIAQVSGVAAHFGWAALIDLAALLSFSLGLMNLVPAPMLDGGHLLFYALEAVRGRALSPRAQDYAMRVGLAMVMALTLFVTINDIRQLFAS